MTETYATTYQYARKKGVVLNPKLGPGGGFQGSILFGSLDTEDVVIKAHERSASYEIERDAYLILQEHDLDYADGFEIPALLGYNDSLMVLMMSLVSPPFVLDFGASHLDPSQEPPEHHFEEREKQIRLYPEGQQQLIWNVIFSLRAVGIEYFDVHTGNIAFEL